MRAVLFALIAAFGLAIFATTPPSPLGKDAAPQQFSASRAMVHVEAIAKAPHPIGSAENARVRGYIADQMRALGMEVSTSEAPIGAESLERLNRWSGRQDEAMNLVNVIGVLPGRDRTLPAVMLMAHHDTVWGSPGAADDTAGIAAALEAVRAVKAGGQPARDLVILATDGEELGLEGAKQFFAQNPLRERVGAVINLEARGGGGRASMFQTSRENGAAAALYARAVTRPAASSLSAFVYSVLPNDTDLTPAIKGPYTAYNLAFIGRPGLYHSPLATPERLDQGSLQDLGQQALELANGLLTDKPLPAKAPDAVFFDVFGLFTAIWPAWLGWPMLVVAVGAIVLVVRRDGRAGLVQGAAQMLGLLVVSSLGLYGLNRLSTLGGHDEYYDRLASIPRLEVVAALVCTAVLAVLFGTVRGTHVRAAGAVTVMALLGIAMQALAPTAAYIVIVPVLLSALALAWPKVPVQVTVAALVAGFMLALGHFLMQGVGADTPMAVALPLALGVLPMIPLWPGLPAKTMRLAATVLLAGAVGMALWVQLDAPAETRAVYARS